MGVPRRFLVTNLLLILPITVNSYFEFCSGQNRYIINQADCPQGVLFQTPMTIDNCYKPGSTSDNREHIDSVCTGSTTEELNNKVQYVGVGSDDSDNDQCTCTGSTPISITTSNTKSEDDTGDDSVEEETKIYAGNNYVDIKNQTLRLFMHMTGNLIDENEGGPYALFPLLDILGQSFKIIKSRTDKTYIPEAFFDDIHKAFLFLFRESETTKIKRISRDEAKQIKQSLDSCEKGNPPMQALYFSGRICETSAKVKFSAKATAGGTKNNTLPYAPNTYSFKWGDLDLIEEATWAVTDFVHGYCYGGFSMRVNNHHLYQRAMERLFTPELIFRWRNPEPLMQDLYWDNIFSTNVKVAMRNLDAAVQAAYLDSPFLHRLKRPWVKNGKQPNDIIRNKRDAGEQVAAWCLSDATVKNKLINKLKSSSC